MIRVLIADDEKIVRMGLVTCMPWSEFGMVVAGEANNGENALQFLETHEVDLLITDLSMPVMSGVELMREVVKKYPHIKIVVLTLHQDFEYVQEALRLGAVDYISKTQLEKENFEDVLRRISGLMTNRIPQNKTQEISERALSDEIIVLYSMTPQEEMSEKHFPIPNGIEADAGIWYWPKVTEHEKKSIIDWTRRNSAFLSHCALVRVREFGEYNQKNLLQVLRIYQKKQLFYIYDPKNPFSEISANDISTAYEDKEHDLNLVKEKWLSGEWINNNQHFDQLKEELKSMKLPPIRLTRIIYSMTDEWNRIYMQILKEPITIEDFLPSWHHLEAWLSEVREIIRSISATPAFSEEIQDSIRKAIVLMQKMMSEPLSAGDIAKMVNMSSSYFSICFKEMVGKTYTEYLRFTRVERAKEYLRTTSKTIQWVSEQVGYHDEKYFSRLFREHVGLLPSEYRQKNRMT